MPQLTALADEFKDKPVAFLGINADADVADAQRVERKFNLEYRTLCDQHDDTTIHEQYHVTMWPTILVLDQHGVLRHVQCGYWPTMRSSLSESIQALLAQTNGHFR